MSRYSLAIATLLTCTAASALAQNLPPAKKVEYDQHVERARAAATLGPMTQGMLDNLCAIPQPRGGRDRPDRPPTQSVEPGQVFDNLYFVGESSVSAWAVKTSAGIILIDTLFNPTQAEDVIVGGLRKLGLDPAQIKYVVIAHGHGDHYGGAQYFADHYKARVLASDADWKLMANEPEAGPLGVSPKPKRDLVVNDGQWLTLGDTTISLYITPGHTPGTVSLVIPVTQDGARHTAVLWGGTGFIASMNAAAFTDYAASADRFRTIAGAMGADVLISNHSTVDLSLRRLPLVRSRKPGDSNPYVIGGPGVGKVFTVLQECALARGAAL